MKKHYSIEVIGDRRQWLFDVWARPEYAKDWRSDGLVVSEIVNDVPLWVMGVGLLRPWCWLQGWVYAIRERMPG